MSSFEAPGLPADWLNGWLAAIGVTALLGDVKLSWTEGAVPHAVFEVPDSSTFLERLAQAMPSESSLAASTIARKLPGTFSEFARNVTLEAYQERVGIERFRNEGLLAASVTDLNVRGDPKSLDHGAFDPGAPRGETLWSRALACAQAAGETDRPEMLVKSLAGSATRMKLNGLGFDSRRLPASVQGTSSRGNFVDPLVELLCLSALPLFPTRGNGRQVRQRGWTMHESKRGAFEWFAWKPSLNYWAIDALLDLPLRSRKPVTIQRYGVVPYQRAGPSDATRAYFGERLK